MVGGKRSEAVKTIKYQTSAGTTAPILHVRFVTFEILLNHDVAETLAVRNEQYYCEHVDELQRTMRRICMFEKSDIGERLKARKLAFNILSGTRVLMPHIKLHNFQRSTATIAFFLCYEKTSRLFI